ncbi:MAG: endonuclease III [Verrucomicrobia bacterium]|nr:endonuclease III [Verrucomicrobiota bacterium]
MKPTDIPAVDRILKKEYARKQAPIIELIRAQTEDPFKILVAVLLSARTKDETTAVVCDRLFATVNNPEDLRNLSIKQIEELIYPIGFYHTKAKHLKQLPDALDTKFDGVIPQTIDELCELPGVGRKTANLVMINAFDKYGMCVDIHVHRISNRLGLIRTKDPYDTEMALRDLLPKRYWKTWNRHLVSFGQTQCKPIRPVCATCPIHRFCDRIGVK